MTREELRGFDGACVAVLFVLVDEADEAWFRTLQLDWHDDGLWLSDEQGGWRLDESQFERVRFVDDELRQAMGDYVEGAQLFLALDVSNAPNGLDGMTMTGLRIPRPDAADGEGGHPIG
ncbi:MAG TPA: hypothetical protein VGX96_20510 [Candidatus Elarobacter sp.]|jgi:hypothetical protein|nr:hypothetical protein [Candidatus Elarobacter sp.]